MSVFYIIYLILVFSSEAFLWNYDLSSSYGPQRWNLLNINCRGTGQSPIDIRTNQVRFSYSLMAFDLPGYETIPRGANWELHNTGNIIQIQLNGDYRVKEGGLIGEYRAMQMDFHWGSPGINGSEHTIDGVKFPMELQILHYNMMYGSYDEALGQKNGIAAFSFLFRAKERENPVLAQIINNLPNIKYKGQHASLRPMPLLSLLPLNLNNYYRYEGSLTAPPCTGGVSWTVFTEYIDISPKQLVQMQRYLVTLSEQESRDRTGGSDDETKISGSSRLANSLMQNNCRSVQELDKRIVYSSLNSDSNFWTAPLSPINITGGVFLGFLLLFFLLWCQGNYETCRDTIVDRVSCLNAGGAGGNSASATDNHLD